jgi:hypothetical protein
MITPPIPTIALPMIWKRTAFIVAVAGICLYLYTGVIDFKYYDQLPREPDVQHGNIYRLNMHGTILYETQEDVKRVQFFEFGGVGLALTGMVLEYFRRKRYGK